MARRPSARNVWIGDWLRANRSTDMAAANAAYKRFLRGGRGGPIPRGVRRNPGGGVPWLTLGALAVAAYVAVPTVQQPVNQWLQHIGFPVVLRPPTAGAV